MVQWMLKELRMIDVWKEFHPLNKLLTCYSSRHMILGETPSIKHSGINLTKDLSQLFESNYGPINKDMKPDISRWTLLPLHMSNRIEIIN